MPRRRYDDDFDDADDDDFDDRPRRRSRRSYADDDYPRPRPRARRRYRAQSRAVITAGVVVGVCIVVAISAVLIAQSKPGGGRGLFGRSADISFAKFKEIDKTTTLAELEQKFGRAELVDRAEWALVTIPRGPDSRFGQAEGNLAAFNRPGTEIDAWYRWKRGPEVIYVATGTSVWTQGGNGLIIKIYLNPKAIEANRGADLNNLDVNKLTPEYLVQPLF